jgi:YD repeat-containing protein
LSYSYDVEGNRTLMSLNGTVYLYNYDAFGRLISISNALGVLAYYSVIDIDYTLGIEKGPE